MTGWTATASALSLIVIALGVVFAGFAAFMMAKQARTSMQALTKELGDLRDDVERALAAVSRVGNAAGDVLDKVKAEAEAVLDTTREVREDVEGLLERTRVRLADFEALVEVVQEEVEETALDATAALRTARTGAGMIGQLRRLVLPRRRGAA